MTSGLLGIGIESHSRTKWFEFIELCKFLICCRLLGTGPCFEKSAEPNLRSVRCLWKTVQHITFENTVQADGCRHYGWWIHQLPIGGHRTAFARRPCRLPFCRNWRALQEATVLQLGYFWVALLLFTHIWSKLQGTPSEPLTGINSKVNKQEGCNQSNWELGQAIGAYRAYLTCVSLVCKI